MPTKTKVVSLNNDRKGKAAKRMYFYNYPIFNGKFLFGQEATVYPHLFLIIYLQ